MGLSTDKDAELDQELIDTVRFKSSLRRHAPGALLIMKMAAQSQLHPGNVHGEHLSAHPPGQEEEDHLHDVRHRRRRRRRRLDPCL